MRYKRIVIHISINNPTKVRFHSKPVLSIVWLLPCTVYLEVFQKYSIELLSDKDIIKFV